MDNCGYYCVSLILENYVQCKEIICYFSLKLRELGEVCKKMGAGGGRDDF